MNRRIWKEFREIWIYPTPLVLALLIYAVWLSSWFSFGTRPPQSSMISEEAIWKNFEWSHHALTQAINLHYGFALMAQYGVLLLAAVALFGSEFKYGSLGRLLAQPIPRRRIWLEKSAAFALAALMLLVADLLIALAAYRQTVFLDQASRAQLHQFYVAQGKPSMYGGFSFAPLFLGGISVFLKMALALLICLPALAHGLTASLFIRQSHTAFWAALIFPLFIYIIGSAFDLMVVKPMLHFSVVEFLENGPPCFFTTDDYGPAREYNEFIKLGPLCLVWSLAVYGLGWVKFKRLEV